MDMAMFMIVGFVIGIFVDYKFISNEKWLRDNVLYCLSKWNDSIKLTTECLDELKKANEEIERLNKAKVNS